MNVAADMRYLNLKTLVIGACLSYGAGIFLMEDATTYAVILNIGIALLALFIKLIISTDRRFVLGMVMVLSFVAGGLAVHITGDAQIKAPYPYIEKYVTLTGRILEPPKTNTNSGSYILGLRTCSYLDQTVKLTDKVDVIIHQSDDKKPPYRYGDIIQVSGFLRLPMPPLNEGDIDLAKWRKTKSVYFELAADYAKTSLIGHETHWYNPADVAWFIRDYCAAAIDRHLLGDQAALTRAILLSDKSGLSDEVDEALRLSGLSHITVASGMHVSCLMLLLTWLLLGFGLDKRWVCGVGLVALGLFALILGCSASILRAAIMTGMYLVATMFGREDDKLLSLFGAALILMLLNPYSVFDIGLQLSFGSVLGILLLQRPIEKFLSKYIKPKWLSSGIAITVSAQLFIAPLVAYYFGYVSVYVILSNLLVSPVVILVIGSGFLVVMCSAVFGFVANLAAGLLYAITTYIIGVAVFVKNLPLSAIRTPQPNINFFLIYSVILYMIYALLHKRRFHVAIAGSACAGVIIACLVMHATAGDVMSVTFINVGQGDAALLRMPDGRIMVIDGGGSAPYLEYDLGEKVFVPYLQRRGINKIDVAVVSHYDKDHAQGIAAALRSMKVSELILPYRPGDCTESYKQSLEELASKTGTRIHYFTEGMALDFGGNLTASALWPTVQMADLPESENNKSLVIKVSFGEMDILFTGDIEKWVEEALVKRGAPLDAEVLKVAHHGSKTSSTPEFIRAVSPIYAVISTGRGSINPLDVDRTEDTLAGCGIEVYRTDRAGDITMYIRKTEISGIDTFRREENIAYLIR